MEGQQLLGLQLAHKGGETLEGRCRSLHPLREGAARRCADVGARPEGRRARKQRGGPGFPRAKRADGVCSRERDKPRKEAPGLLEVAVLV